MTDVLKCDSPKEGCQLVGRWSWGEMIGHEMYHLA